MQDNDGDSRMSSAASSPSDPATAATGTSMATSNSNGKRPITTISNGEAEQQQTTIYPTPGVSSLSVTAEAEAEEIANMANGAASSKGTAGRATGAEYAPQGHEASGYTWTRDEDMPGWAWRNTKAMDEAARAADAIVHKESMVLRQELIVTARLQTSTVILLS
ncbi:hypothetical protein K431DRAFT_293161 [Polychaeton citri CBS 116435]|uniref:Uncharacterized protein n=1 Tax=Polychaeton citri CBS 116435 TaxID=1314669 RepID=A0A9P4US86_9PEZI|nr:hypothetical protein K431DRAFT_293161 [Polychaeton citri CBS 116435]